MHPFLRSLCAFQPSQLINKFKVSCHWRKGGPTRTQRWDPQLYFPCHTLPIVTMNFFGMVCARMCKDSWTWGPMFRGVRSISFHMEILQLNTCNVHRESPCDSPWITVRIDSSFAWCQVRLWGGIGFASGSLITGLLAHALHSCFRQHSVGSGQWNQVDSCLIDVRPFCSPFRALHCWHHPIWKSMKIHSQSCT